MKEKIVKAIGIGIGAMAVSLAFSCGAVLGVNAVLDSDEETQEEWRQKRDKIPRSIMRATFGSNVIK